MRNTVTMSSTRSRNGSARPNYAIDATGLDIPDTDDRDDDYNEENDNKESNAAGDDDVEEEDNANEESDDDYEKAKEREEKEARKARAIAQLNKARPKAKRGRPPKRKYRQAEDEGAVTELSGSERSRSNSVIGGYPAAKRYHFPYPVDSEGNPILVVNEEYDLPVDEEGERKITKDGDLLDGRKFLVRTFKLMGKGETKFMSATEAARAIGFKDSYLFFQYHPNLYKIIVSQEQKNALIEAGVLPHSFKSRQIALVTARSVFREFGASSVVGGKNITDDYYATKLRDEGKVTEGSLSRDLSKRNLAKQGSWDSSAYYGVDNNPAKNTVEFFERRNQHSHRVNADAELIANATTGTHSNQINAKNWLYQHAAACSRFNSDMYYDRVRVLLIENQGIRDPYTNVLHIPGATQSEKVLSYKNTGRGKRGAVEYETIISDSNAIKPRTGLSEVPREIYEDLLDESVIQDIEAQVQFEKGN